ncbi:MAG: Arsenate reductase glutaredoxin-coupled [uncultured Thermomicrobiales bacterium]|uniref:Arsenate reductase glutaredoxin-coupled n=1 Tax=uncultured Thermomicrobiales bacterium TaxID=1645740 RepID=A0A6J4UU74_9BACT|nr:MAG: Arsenate reductase glutaredoxin-coupled [uncultured Thermomicrobiales bacterium]
MQPSDVLSRRAKAYKELIGDSEVAEEELLQLMVQEPMLLRRPLAIKDGRAAIGFDKARLTALVDDA